MRSSGKQPVLSTPISSDGLQEKKEILFVSHDANRAGAQIFLYNVMAYLQDNGYSVVLLLVNDWGNLRETFESRFVTYSMSRSAVSRPAISRWSRLLRNPPTVLETIKAKHQIGLVYVNTIAAVHLLESLKSTWQVPLVTHIHELSYSISQYGPADALPLLFRHSDTIVACSDAVAVHLRQYEKTDRIRVIHSFVDNEQILKVHTHSDRTEVLQEWGLDPGYTWIGACGNADWRKAPDIFVQIAARVSDPSIRFAWIGIREDDPIKSHLEYDAARLGISDKIAWLPPTPAAVELINAMDLFLLCSREDPFPLVMLEAALCQKPVLAFKNTGGGDEFIEQDAGWQAEYLNVEQMAALIASVTPSEKKKRGEAAQKKVLERYNFNSSMKKIRDLVDENFIFLQGS